MARRIHGFPHLLHMAGGTGGGLVVDHADRTDRPGLVRLQSRFDLLGLHTPAPIAFNELGLVAKPLCQLLPERCELPGFYHEQRVAWIEQVHPAPLPTPPCPRTDRSPQDAPSGRSCACPPAPPCQAGQSLGRDDPASAGQGRGGSGLASSMGPGICRKWRPRRTVMGWALQAVTNSGSRIDARSRF